MANPKPRPGANSGDTKTGADVQATKRKRGSRGGQRVRERIEARHAAELEDFVNAIQGKARERQRKRLAGKRNEAQSRTTDLLELYGKVRDTKAGQIPVGQAPAPAPSMSRPGGKLRG